MAHIVVLDGPATTEATDNINDIKALDDNFKLRIFGEM